MFGLQKHRNSEGTVQCSSVTGLVMIRLNYKTRKHANDKIL